MIRAVRRLLTRIPTGVWTAAVILALLSVVGMVAVHNVNEKPVRVELGDHQPYLTQRTLEPAPPTSPASAVRAAARHWTHSWLRIRAGADPSVLRRWSTSQFGSYAATTRPAGVPAATVTRLQVEASGETYGVVTVNLSNDEHLTITCVVAPPAGWRVAGVDYRKAGQP